MRQLLAALAIRLRRLRARRTRARRATRRSTPAMFSRVAVGGYDPVAYFTDGRPVRGSNQFRIMHQGYEYRFASAEHLAAFRANPARYVPQYGGYCAWAVSQGYTASGDPDHWRIVDGRLYLNYNAEIQRRWEGDIPGHIRNGDANWPRVLAR